MRHIIPIAIVLVLISIGTISCEDDAEDVIPTNIENVTDISEWPSGASYSNYDNDTTNGSIYGRLYNWFAVDDSRNIAPEGWHVATDEEWKELEMFLGSDAGGKLKATGTVEGGDGLWYEPNEGATNESGFSTLPGGVIRIACSGQFGGLGEAALFWTSTEVVGSVGYAWVRSLTNNSSEVFSIENSPKSYGYSVRCVLD
jgi:uncharacterized protein (TIGR02145 family)